jgi:glycosyltransferase involved in cell wall biosynthesis
VKLTSENISIIIPTYNRENLLPKAIDSLLAQTYRHFEIIRVDDGSTDNTRASLKKYHNDRIRYVYQENSGPAAARNRGIREAQ